MLLAEGGISDAALVETFSVLLLDQVLLICAVVESHLSELLGDSGGSFASVADHLLEQV